MAATTLSISLAELCKLLDERENRTVKRVVSELKSELVALSRKLEEESDDSRRVFAALMTVLSEKQKRQFKIAYEMPGRTRSGSKSRPAWRETAPEDSSDDEDSMPQLSKPWILRGGLVSVTEGIKNLELGCKVPLSPNTKPFWDPTGRNVSITSHTDRKGQATMEQSSKPLTPLRIMAKVPKWDDSFTTPTSPSWTSSASSPFVSTPPSSPASIATPSSMPHSPSPLSTSSPSSPFTPPTPSPPARNLLSAQKQTPILVRSLPLHKPSIATPTLAPESVTQTLPQNSPQKSLIKGSTIHQHEVQDMAEQASRNLDQGLTARFQGTSPITLDRGMDGVTATTPEITLDVQAAVQTSGVGSNAPTTLTSTALPASLKTGSNTLSETESTTDARMDDAPTSIDAINDTEQAAAPDCPMDDTPVPVDTTTHITQALGTDVQQTGTSSSTHVAAESVIPQSNPPQTAHQVKADETPLPLDAKEFMTAHAALTGPLITRNMSMKRKAGDGAYSNWSKPTTVQSDPELFSLPASQYFDDSLFCAIRKTVRRNEELAMSQAWFESFCPSTLDIADWASRLSHPIRNDEKFFENMDDGQAPGLREKYMQFIGFAEDCGNVPFVWKFRTWLENVVLPYLMTVLVPELILIPAPDTMPAGLMTADRTESLTRIFDAVAKAYLRMVLLKAQGSCDKMNLSKYGGPTLLPRSTIVDWEVLQDMASSIEFAQANKVEQDAQTPLTAYKLLVQSAIKRFNTNHASLERQLPTVRQNSAEKLSDMHERWSSVAAYLKDAEAQHKLVPDNGVQHLQYKLKRQDLCERGALLDPALQYNVDVGVPAVMRRTAFREILVRLHLAHDEFSAIHLRSIYKPTSNVMVECTATALKMEAGIMHDMTRLVSHLSLTPKRISEIYVDKARMFQKQLIDFPIDALKEAVLDSHGETTTMTTANSGVDSARGQKLCPQIEQVPHFPSMQAQNIIEPHPKRRRYHGQHGDDHHNLSGTPLFYFNDREPSGAIDHEFEENEALDICRDAIEFGESDHDSDDDSDESSDGGMFDDGDDNTDYDDDSEDYSDAG